MKPFQIFETFFISALISYLITPFIRQVAIKLDYMDHPKNNKVHGRPVPMLGGLAIFVAFVIAVIMKDQLIASAHVKAALLGVTILLVVGLVDDRMGMMPSFKLLGQFLAAMVVIKSGLKIEFIKDYYLSTIVTYIWIIGITNSMNLLDNMNGLSAGVSVISASFFGIISLMNGQLAVSALSFALAGSAVGFLRYNFPKAQIFMGDSGSLVLGYTLAVLALLASWKSYILTTSLAIPVLVLGYPVFDTTLVTIMRVLERRSIFQGGKDHSSHRLALLGFKRYRSVLIIYGVCICLGLTAVAITKLHWTTGIMLIAVSFILMLAFGIRLGFINTSRFGYKKD